MKKIVILLGPTCCGKTEISTQLKSVIPIEIISADSRQIYKHLNIGTNKPPGQWLTENNKKYYIYKDIIHHLVDFVDPDSYYNVAKFYSDASKAIDDIYQKEKIPIIVGGTGLYIKSLTDGITELPQKNESIRLQLIDCLKTHGKEFLYKKLTELDPLRAKEIHPNNIQRVIRSLEIILQTGEPFSTTIKNYPKTKTYNYLAIGLIYNKNLLKEKITQRTEWMFKNGIVEETQNTITKYGENIPALTSIGYRWVIKLIKNEISLQEAKSNFTKDTLNYAKRQITWFKKEKNIKWINCEEYNSQEEISKLINNYIIKELWKE
ncbi:MAG: tRNA (adenosine(37)-N6)-dimethylallyltransferase MiaA [Endomicrobia bacterium]|nr:tRNA (adenosine(37)-N6)-dimethylallyltransferase MiaA [Endomicrobiia bacterium]